MQQAPKIVALAAAALGLASSCETRPSQAINRRHIEHVLLSEAANQGPQGLYAVACVLRNRGWSLVGFQGAQRQDLGAFAHGQPDDVRQAAHDALQAMLSGGRDITLGANHFANTALGGTPWWAQGRAPTVVIRDHTFWRIE